MQNSIGGSSTLGTDWVTELVLVTSKTNLCALNELDLPVTIKLHYPFLHLGFFGLLHAYSATSSEK